MKPISKNIGLSVFFLFVCQLYSLLAADNSETRLQVNQTAQTAQKLVVLKLDDLVAGTKGVAVPERFQRVADFLESKNIKYSLGVLGYSLLEDNPVYFTWITDRAERGSVEFWNHGLLQRKQNPDGTFEPQYAVDEFLRSYAEQLHSLTTVDSLAKAKLGLEFSVWGPHWSNANLDTDRALAQVGTIKMTFGYPPVVEQYKGFVLRNRIDIEYPTHNPDYEAFLINYAKKSKEWDYFYMQGHPASWDDTRWENFIKIIEYLEKEGVRFVTPSELYKILGY